MDEYKNIATDDETLERLHMEYLEDLKRRKQTLTLKDVIRWTLIKAQGKPQDEKDGW